LPLHHEPHLRTKRVRLDLPESIEIRVHKRTEVVCLKNCPRRVSLVRTSAPIEGILVIEKLFIRNWRFEWNTNIHKNTEFEIAVRNHPVTIISAANFSGVLYNKGGPIPAPYLQWKDRSYQSYDMSRKIVCKNKIK
jgi:hypothetical protein